MKIAIVGSHPETWDKAPFKDTSWDIWGFSRKNWKSLPRFDLWFELHRYRGHFNPAYVDWIDDNEKVVGPNDFPWEDHLKEFGPYFFSFGQAGWLMAHAITQKPETIGLWGIDAARPKYGEQRHEIHYFTSVARYRGIAVVAPDDPDLLTPGKLYAFS